MLDSASGLADAQAGEMGQTRAVQAATSTSRHGAYYLPQRHESRTLPLLVFFPFDVSATVLLPLHRVSGAGDAAPPVLTEDQPIQLPRFRRIRISMRWP